MWTNRVLRMRRQLQQRRVAVSLPTRKQQPIDEAVKEEALWSNFLRQVQLVYHLQTAPKIERL